MHNVAVTRRNRALVRHLCHPVYIVLFERDVHIISIFPLYVVLSASLRYLDQKHSPFLLDPLKGLNYSGNEVEWSSSVLVKWDSDSMRLQLHTWVPCLEKE